MPVFGKGRAGKRVVEREILRIREISGSGSTRRYLPQEKYGATTTSLNEIRQLFHLLFSPKKPFSIPRQLKIRQRPLVVVDWGCGTGRAISSLAIKFKENVHAYGFSKDSYKEWEDVREAKLIHAPAEDFFRYFKDESIDALYSHLGLVHMAPLGFDVDYGLRTKAIDYIAKVFRKISRGGLIAFDAPASGFFIEDLENRLGKQAKIIVIRGRVGSKIRDEIPIVYILKNM